MLELSPGKIGKARVKVPVVTMSPVANGGLTGSRASADELPQRRQRAVENIGGRAAIDHGTIAQQLDLETSEIGHPIGGAAEASRMARRKQPCAVQAIDDDGVGGRELPARKHRLHNLEALCHPGNPPAPSPAGDSLDDFVLMTPETVIRSPKATD